MFKKKEEFVNEQKKQPNYIAVMILSIIISVSWTSNYYEFMELRIDYNRAIKIIERIEDSGVTAVSRVESNVKDSDMTAIDLVETSVTPSDDEGVISPSTDWESTVEKQIRKVAHDEGFKDEQLLVDIAMCESSLDPTRPCDDHTSTSLGLFQFNKGTWYDGNRWSGNDWTQEDRTDIEKATRMAIYFISRGEIWRWNASKHCWG